MNPANYPWWTLVLVFVISYLLGSVNFSKILTRLFWHKNIEKEGSGNPGTMNMIRMHGALAGFLTLLLEVVKAGLTAWLCRFILDKYFPTVGGGNLVFYFSGLALVIGSCFPLLGFVKGGKGVAVAGGVFLFSDLWWLALALFAVGVIQIVITEYGFISCMIFVLGMAIGTTIFVFLNGVQNAALITVLVWIICLLIYAKHYKNFYRLFTHQENKAGFKDSFKKIFSKGTKTAKNAQSADETLPSTDKNPPPDQNDQKNPSK